MNANIKEVFLSIQGEGLWIGKRQIFIRFSGCNLRCDFCDTKDAQIPSKECLIFKKKVKNPIEIGLLKESLKKKTFHSISLTGGEPLLQIDFIKEFLKEKEYFVCLDTNGSLPDEFEKIKDIIDFVCMDIKLPSSTKEKPIWEEHKRFLKKIKDGFVKIVITKETSKDDFLKGVRIIKDIDPKIPLVIQPDGKVSFDKPFFFQKMAFKQLSEVRIIPQIHKILGIR
ncbi:MAG: 7-carboxy-7-deazaguanine synthase QueE [bacterium]